MGHGTEQALMGFFNFLGWLHRASDTSRKDSPCSTGYHAAYDFMFVWGSRVLRLLPSRFSHSFTLRKRLRVTHGKGRSLHLMVMV
jgi:hypothetical protein